MAVMILEKQKIELSSIALSEIEAKDTHLVLCLVFGFSQRWGCYRPVALCFVYILKIAKHFWERHWSSLPFTSLLFGTPSFISLGQVATKG